MSIQDFSTTALSNGSADPNINFAENQAPSTVNDSARSLMTRLAHWRNWLSGNVTQGGTGNAYTFTSGESLTAYTNGLRLAWKPNANASGVVTLNVDGLGAKKVYRPDGTTQATTGDIISGNVLDVVYISALDASTGGFQIVGSSREASTSLHVTATDRLIGRSAAGAGPSEEITCTGFGRSLLDDADATAGRATLALGTAATQNTGTSGATIPLLNGANTFSAQQTFTAGQTLQGDGFGTTHRNADATARWIDGIRTDITGNNAYVLYDVVAGLQRARFTTTGDTYFPGAAGDATASGANCFIDSATGRLQRSTSALKYKRDVEDMGLGYAERFVYGARPVWYRSKIESDNPDYGFWGFIADEVAELDPRLVSFGYADSDYDLVERPAEPTYDVVEDAEGNPQMLQNNVGATWTVKVLRQGAKATVPEGFQYDRTTPLIVKVLQAQRERINSLEARIAALEASP